jgi:hypothetical protein
MHQWVRQAKLMLEWPHFHVYMGSSGLWVPGTGSLPYRTLR